MATFNSMAVIPGLFAYSQVLYVWPSAAELDLVFGVAATAIAPVWPPVAEAIVISFTPHVATMFSEQPRIEYDDGYIDGERIGFSSELEEPMEPIQLGETDDDKKTVSFRIYTTQGLPASGLAEDGVVCVPAVGEVQTNRDLAGYVNSVGTFTHVGDGVYRYTFAASEVAAGQEGNIWLRVKVSGFRTVVQRVPIRNLAPSAAVVANAVLDAARSGHVGVGTVGEGIALAASLLQGNYYMDNVTNTANGQTAARLRCFHTGAAAQAATAGGVGEGEFATFLVATSFSGPNKITDHRVVQQ
jgi:hypothetical protein